MEDLVPTIEPVLQPLNLDQQQTRHNGSKRRDAETTAAGAGAGAAAGAGGLAGELSLGGEGGGGGGGGAVPIAFERCIDAEASLRVMHIFNTSVEESITQSGRVTSSMAKRSDTQKIRQQTIRVHELLRHVYSLVPIAQSTDNIVARDAAKNKLKKV